MVGKSVASQMRLDHFPGVGKLLVVKRWPRATSRPQHPRFLGQPLAQGARQPVPLEISLPGKLPSARLPAHPGPSAVHRPQNAHPPGAVRRRWTLEPLGKLPAYRFVQPPPLSVANHQRHPEITAGYTNQIHGRRRHRRAASRSASRASSKSSTATTGSRAIGVDDGQRCDDSRRVIPIQQPQIRVEALGPSRDVVSSRCLHRSGTNSRVHREFFDESRTDANGLSGWMVTSGRHWFPGAP